MENYCRMDAVEECSLPLSVHIDNPLIPTAAKGAALSRT